MGLAMTSVRIFLQGHIDDLYALSLLFPVGAHPDLYVCTSITGEKVGTLNRATDPGQSRPYVTGEGCLPLIDYAGDPQRQAEWAAREIIAPLNGYAVLADSNYTPVTPIGARFDRDGHVWLEMSFGTMPNNSPIRLVTTDRHPTLRQGMMDRVRFMTENNLAAYAANVIAGPPSWAEYYRLLEDIAGHLNTTLDKLHLANIARRKALNAFKNAANNRAFGRHGTSNRNVTIPQDDLMNLLEAREFVRQVVASWLDRECGGYMPRDRVDGPMLRFGLDESHIAHGSDES